MINEKSKPLAYRRNMQNSSNQKFFFPFLAVVLIFLTIAYYSSSNNIIPKDRSETFNVKIIPSDLTDANLAELNQEVFSYVAVIDAGSSGCRAHVYRYGKLGSITGPLYVLPQHQSFKVKPGLSSFATNPNDAGPSLEKLVDFIKQQVPEMVWKDTPIWLKATAGLRMLDKSTSSEILLSVRNFLKDSSKSPFYFKPHYAQIISGSEEGAFGWIAFNYLKKVIGPKKVGNVLPYAVVEMGGASSQVSQVAPSKAEADLIPSEYKYSFNIEEDEFNLYTYSYLGFGAEQGREGINKQLSTAQVSKTDLVDPCLYRGYKRQVARKDPYEGPVTTTSLTGASSNKLCIEEVSKLFGASDRSTCQVKGPVSFNCIPQPAFVTASPNFLVFENFYYLSSAIGVKADTESSSVSTDSTFPLITTPNEIYRATAKVCNMSWSEVQTTYPLDDQGKDTNLKWCFSGSYAYSFLTKGLGIPSDKRVTVQKFVDGSEIEWALGAALKEASDFLKRNNLRQQQP